MIQIVIDTEAIARNLHRFLDQQEPAIIVGRYDQEGNLTWEKRAFEVHVGTSVIIQGLFSSSLPTTENRRARVWLETNDTTRLTLFTGE